MNKYIGMAFFLAIFLVIWWTLAMLPLWDGITILIPPAVALGASIKICEKTGILRIVAELTFYLVIDQIRGVARVVKSGIQFFAPWEKIEGNIFSITQESQTFSGQFETRDNSGLIVRVQITLVPDTRTVESVSAFNGLGADAMHQAFKRYGPAAAQVIQRNISKFTLNETQQDRTRLLQELKFELDYGVSPLERNTGTIVEGIEIESIDPDQETVNIQRFDKRVQTQVERAQKIVGASGNSMSFEKALEAVQRADKDSKVSSVNVQGGARPFIDV